MTNFGARVNDLFHNNGPNAGNSNSWLVIRCDGTVSNRSAIGAKVRVRATIRGKTFWQLREISGGGGYTSQNDLRAQFGLGDAAVAELVRIEWPSGIVQTMTKVPTKEFLTVIEPSRLSMMVSADSSRKFSLRGGRDFAYALEASSDLTSWLPLQTNTVSGLTLEVEDSDAVNFSRRFYRARLVVP